MAKAFCIPKAIAEQIKEAFRSGEVNMKTLWEMDSKGRHDFFAKYVDPATALRINAGFEKAMISEQQNALVKWAEKLFKDNTTETKSKKQDILDKIKQLDELGYVKGTKGKGGEIKLDEGSRTFLNDLVEESIGVSLTEDEIKTLVDKVKVVEQYENELNKFGLPVDEYWKARKDVENYMKSLTPSSQLKVASSIIARGTMLFSVKSPLLNIGSNTLFGTLQVMEKRLARMLTGRNITATKSTVSYGKEWKAKAVQISAKYGYDVTRIFDLKSDIKTLGEERGVHSQGKGVIRKIGRFYEDVVFSKMLTLPDVFYSASAFADSASLWSTEIAKSEGLKGEELDKRSLEIMQDSTKIEPLTEQGQKVRELAILDAQHATFTDDTVYSRVGLGIRNVIDTATGDLAVGKQIIPFVKTPANVVGAGLDMGGVGLVQGAIQIPDAVKAFKNGDVVLLDKAIRKIVATGLGWTLAYILASLIKPEDFIGAYPSNSKELELMYLQNATPNSIKIGNKWISLDYFGALSTPMLGILYAIKYKSDPKQILYAYANGAKTALSNFPGMSEVANITDSLSNGTEIVFDPEKFKKDIISGSIDFVRARSIPAFISDFAKMTDKFERDTTASKDILGKLKNSIPALRETLPIKENVIGQEVETEPWISTLLFGSRVKTANEVDFVKEVSRLSDTGNTPSISNVEYTSSRVKDMKLWISKDKYNEMIDLYRTTWKKEAEKAITKSSYKKLADDKKADELNKIRSDALDKALNKYGYKGLSKKNKKK